MTVLTSPLNGTREDECLTVRLLREGDAVAFSEFFNSHRDELYSFVHALLRNRQDSEEVVQDAFVRAHRGLKNFRGECSLRTWLFHIAKNLARNRFWYDFRRHRDHHFPIDDPIPGNGENSLTLEDVIPSDVPAAHELLYADEVSSAARYAMRRLEANHRTVIELRLIQHCSYEEIALRTGTNVGTVKSRIARARGLLYEFMRHRLDELRQRRPKKRGCS